MESASYNEIPIDSFDQFVSEVGKPDLHQAVGSSMPILFRGQEDDLPLLPRIGRPGYVSQNILVREEDLMAEFYRLIFPHLSHFSYRSPWDELAIAQHHTLPTRLLDWTENPLVALWFAFIKENQENPPRVVWAFSITKEEIVDSIEDSPYVLSRTKAFRPNHVTKTITAQNGWFTAHALTKESPRFVALERNAAYKGRLTKFPFNSSSSRSEILRRLDRMGINSMSLFPDLYGISRYLQWKVFDKVS